MFSIWALTYIGSEPFRLPPRGEGGVGERGRGKGRRESRASHEFGVKFETVISQKRLEITISIWYANFSGAQALSIGKGFEAVGGHISEKVGQNLILVFELQKGWKR